MVDWSKNIVASDFSWVYSLIKPLSAYGKEAHRSFKFFKRGQEQELQDYFSQVEAARDFIKTEPKKTLTLKRLLKQIVDIDKQLEQIELGEVTDINLYEINRCCNLLKQILDMIKYSSLNTLEHCDQQALLETLGILKKGNKVDGSFYVSDSYSERLADLRNQLRNCERSLIKEKQANSQNVRFVLGRNINSKFTISKHETEIVEKLKAISNVEQLGQSEYTIKYLVKDNERIINLKEHKQKIEHSLYLELKHVKQKIGEQLAPLIPSISKLLKKVGSIDVLIARAFVANELKCVTPQIVRENTITIVKGRHPLLEKKLEAKNTQFTPRTIDLLSGVSLRTGINMGGKTITLRLIQLLTTMVHAAMPVPAMDMKIGLRDYIHFSKSDEDSILTGLSHFGQEINQIKEVLKHENDWGLVLIDEIAHGTSPVAGESLAIAILERLHKSNNIVIVTTHYTGISEKVPVYEWQTQGLDYDKWHLESLVNKKTDIQTLSSCIDYSLVRVSKKNQERSEALKIASLLGLDQQILDRAKQLVAESNREKSLNKGGKDSE